ncbi:MAG: hypothetical protein WB498_02050 [Candidatus Binatus sp.]|jgi:hypothetical protein
MSDSSTGTNKRGIDVLHDPRMTKSTGYTEAERQALGLVGLVPDVTESIETQLSRVLLQLKSKTTDLERFIYLMGLLDANETLFYRTLMSDPARFLEILYDPTIAEACLKFDHIFRQPRDVSVDHPQGACQGSAAQLAGQRRAVHLRDKRGPHPRPGRPGRQRHGNSNRKIAALHRGCRLAARGTAECVRVKKRIE